MSLSVRSFDSPFAPYVLDPEARMNIGQSAASISSVMRGEETARRVPLRTRRRPTVTCLFAHVHDEIAVLIQDDVVESLTVFVLKSEHLANARGHLVIE